MTAESNPTSRHLVLIFDRRTESSCTAVLIRQNILLTAAHCIKSAPEYLTLAFGNRPLEGQYVARSARRILTHPEYNKSQTLDRNDLALILLKDGAPSSHIPLDIPDASFPLKRGQTFTAAGFGRITGKGDPQGNDIQGSGTLRHVDLVIDEMSKNQKQFAVDQTTGRGVCHGDSGGPAMMSFKGKNYVVGIASAISWSTAKSSLTETDYCNHKSIYISTKEYKGWIEESIQKLLLQ